MKIIDDILCFFGINKFLANTSTHIEAKYLRALLIKNEILDDYIFIADSDYLLITERQLFLILEKIRTNKHYKKQLYDCDDFALVTNADIKMVDLGQKLPLAFGECWTTKLNNKKRYHALNIVILDTLKIMLVEPQNYTYREYHKDLDTIDFLRI